MKDFEPFLRGVLFVLLEIEHLGDALAPLPDNRGVEFVQVVEGKFHGLIAQRLDLRLHFNGKGRQHHIALGGVLVAARGVAA